MNRRSIVPLISRRRKWDKPLIAAALRERRAKGLDLNPAAVERADRSLYMASSYHYGKYEAALRAAGIDPGSVHKRLSWNKARVVRALRERVAKGLDVNAGALLKTDIPLAGAIQRYFRQHDAAIRAAGIDPESARKGISWDRPRILQELRSRLASGLAVNAGAVKRTDGALYNAMRLHFGSHDNALRAVGIEPESVRKVTWWGPKMIIARLRERARLGVDLHVQGMKKSDWRLCSAMIRHFGSHDAALLAAGIDSATVRRRIPWDKDRVIAALRKRRREGLGLNVSAMRADVKLLLAMRSHFGSHDAALRAAGIDPGSVRKARRRRTGDEILAALRELARDGVLPWPLRRSGNVSLERAAIHRFGSVRAAAQAAGIRYEGPPGRLGLGHWTEVIVLKNLRDLHKAGHDLRYRHMKDHSQPLFFAAKQLFGTYVNAVKQAGIDYWEMSQAQLARERAAASTAGADVDG